jgi:hypothetical protein
MVWYKDDDWRSCPTCKEWYYPNTFHQCRPKVETPNNSNTGGMMGWMCPRCGAGNSPYVSRCPCVPYPKMEITC